VQIRRTYMATSEETEQREVVLGWLDVLSDGYCNKHLMFAILELLVVRIMPEVGEKSVEDLRSEKLGSRKPLP
jgi:hypothetical protein